MGDSGTSKVRSIRSTLLRLGLHTSGQRIVAESARHGIEVSEDQVERVRIDLLTEHTAQIRGQGDRVQRSERRRILPRKEPGRHR